MDTRAIEEFITTRTKALAVVHYLGVPLKWKKFQRSLKNMDCFCLRIALSPGAVSMEFTLGSLAMQVASRSVRQHLTMPKAV